MLRHTFCHLPGIGPHTELQLWRAGIATWQDLLAQSVGSTHYPGKRSLTPQVEESLAHLAAGNPRYFHAQLPSEQRWRLFADFRPRCAYFDIETTGLNTHGDQITTVCLYDGQTMRYYVHGYNLDDFPRDLAAYPLVVTFNGTSFDLPFVRRYFNVEAHPAHVDLRYVLQGLGFRGGLKKCEQRLGVTRPGLEEVDGFMAVNLWYEYQRTKNRAALETLLAYNMQDVLNLEILMVEAFNRKVRETPFAALHELPSPALPANPFHPDPAVVQRLGGGRSWTLPFARGGAAPS